MIDYLVDIDKQLFLFLNGFHSENWDGIMWWISGKLTWWWWYLIIIGFVIYKYRTKAWVILVAIALTVLLADQISVHLFKNVFERLRPCHDPYLTNLVHVVHNKCGGTYGFISSHATNSFGVATLLSMLFHRKWMSVILLFWAAIVSYSRVYLGVHFPADIIVGAMVGVLIGYFVSVLTAKVLSIYPFVNNTSHEIHSYNG